MNDNPINIQSDDSALIESFNSGNEQAFNYLVLKYQKRVYWVIRRMVLDHDDADDITQEVFIKVYSVIKDFRGESGFFTYLYRIAINMSLNHLTKQKRVNSKKGDFELEGLKIHSNETAADKKFDDELNKRLLENAIEKLPEQQRAVFNMRFYDNLSYEEISEILKTSVGGLKANYFHAMKKLHSLLKNKINEFTTAI